MFSFLSYACPQTNSSTTVACEPGTYSVGGQETCTECPAGKACPVTTLDIKVDCTAGTYSEANQAACTLCPAGWECPDTNQNSR